MHVSICRMSWTIFQILNNHSINIRQAILNWIETTLHVNKMWYIWKFIRYFNIVKLNINLVYIWDKFVILILLLFFIMTRSQSYNILTIKRVKMIIFDSIIIKRGSYFNTNAQCLIWHFQNRFPFIKSIEFSGYIVSNDLTLRRNIISFSINYKNILCLIF